MSDVPAPTLARTLATRVGVATLLWSGAILLSRVAGLVRDIALGRTLGVGAEADVWQAAFVIPDFVHYLLAGGLLSLAFLPLFARHLHAGREDRGWESFSDVANALLLLALPIVAIAAFATPWLAPLVAGGFDAERLALLARLSRIILPAQVLLMLGALLGATLQARERHAPAAFAPTAYTIGIVAVGLLLYPCLGPEGFAWGVLAGAALGAFGVPFVACLRSGMRWTARLRLSNPDVRAYVALALPVMVGQSIVALDSWLWKWQGSWLETGAVARLGYARTLMNVPAGIFGLAAGAAAYPVLVRLHGEKRSAEGYALLTAAARSTLFLAFLAQALLTVLGEDLVRLVWGAAGRGFADSDVRAIAESLSLFSLSLGAWSLHPLLARAFYARGNTWLPTAIGTVVTLLAIPLYVAMRHALGATGLALASSIALAGYVVPLHLALRRTVRREAGGDPPLPRWGGFVARGAAALAITAAALWGVREALLLAAPGMDALSCAVRVAVVGLAAAPVAFAAARLLGIDEARALAVRTLARLRP